MYTVAWNEGDKTYTAGPFETKHMANAWNKVHLKTQGLVCKHFNVTPDLGTILQMALEQE